MVRPECERQTTSHLEVAPYQPTPTQDNIIISQFETELLKKLDGAEDTAIIEILISEKVLESYRNGITAGQKGAQVIREDESRRHGFLCSDLKKGGGRAIP